MKTTVSTENRQSSTSPKPKPTSEPSASPAAEQDEQLRERAYRYWEDAGCPTGDGVEFWLRAETELAVAPHAGRKNAKSRSAGK